MPVIKHNKLIETSYKLNSREQFFVLYLISQISQGAQGFREHTMHYSEIEGILNFDGKRRIANRSEVFMLMDRLNSEPIVYEMGNIIGKSVWLQHMEHNKDTDEFTFSLSEKLREYLLQLKEHFTKYNLINIAYLNGNAVRLYELLKRHQFQGECEFTIEKLKFYLGIEGSYPKFYDFKRWVLLPSQKEIAKFTDIGFEFRPGKKKGKKILSLRFSIFDNQPEYEPELIHLFKKIEKTDRIGERPEVEQQKLIDLYQQQANDMTRSQVLALAFLGSKGVNQRFILEQILEHEKVKYEPLQGYEDIYIKQVWQFFNSKSKATKKAGAFVNWWKNGRLTTDNFHARMIEAVISKKKGMSEEERQKRKLAKKMPANDFENQWRENAKKQPVIIPEPEPLNLFSRPKAKPLKVKKNFIFNNFKRKHPLVYKEIQKGVTKEYKDTFKSLGQSFDLDKYKAAIESRTEAKCKAWWKDNK